jgi:ATP-dependent RNA helicase DDX24/MAK5
MEALAKQEQSRSLDIFWTFTSRALMVRQDPPVLAGSKRRLQQNSLARKRTKTRHKTTDALPWKVVKRPVEAGMGGDDGILELEEVDDVEVVYEETEGGRVVTFNVSFP